VEELEWQQPQITEKHSIYKSIGNDDNDDDDMDQNNYQDQDQDQD